MVALVLTLACGSSSSTSHLSPNASSTPASASPSAVTTSQAFPSPSPGVTASVAAVPLSCSSTPAAGEHLALVTLRGSSNVVVRDVTDVSHPSSRCTFKGGGYFRFYNATHVSYIVMASGDLGASGALYLADLRTRTTSLVRAWSDGGFESWIYAWSPNGQYLTYISSDSSGAQWHMLSAAGDRKLLDLGTIPGRDVDPNGDDATVGFSADGQFVAVEQTFTQGKGATGSAPPIQVNRVSDGSVAYSRTDGTMAAWAGAGARLYFRTGAGVESWKPRWEPHRVFRAERSAEPCQRGAGPDLGGHSLALREPPGRSCVSQRESCLVLRRVDLHHRHALRPRPAPKRADLHLRPRLRRGDRLHRHRLLRLVAT